jgi:hypothetical protein
VLAAAALLGFSLGCGDEFTCEDACEKAGRCSYTATPIPKAICDATCDRHWTSEHIECIEKAPCTNDAVHCCISDPGPHCWE